MPDLITTRLIDERQSIVVRAEGLKQTAAEQKRDLNDDERKTLGEFSERIARVDEQLKLTTRNYALDEETAAAIARFSPSLALPAEGFSYRSEGEALWDVLHVRDDEGARARLSRVKLNERAAQHMGTTAAGQLPLRAAGEISS